MALTLQLIPGDFAICRLPPSELVPSWAGSAVFSSVTRTPEELSILCPSSQVPAEIKHEGSWRLLKLEGPFAFDAIGILASVVTPLAAARVSSLAIASFDTDHVLVQAGRLEQAILALESAGHRVQSR